MKNLLTIICVCFIVTIITPKEIRDKVIRLIKSSPQINLDTETDVNYETSESVKDNDLEYNHTSEEIQYFNEVVLKSEYKSEIKENPNRYHKNVLIYLDGNPNQIMINEVKKVVGDLNDLIDPISIGITNVKSESCITMYFGDINVFRSTNPDCKQIQTKNLPGYVKTKSNDGKIKSGKIFINLDKLGNTDKLRHVIREELTQSFGLMNDTYTYSNSIFYEGESYVTEYSEMDKTIIKMLYNEK
jgi:hypothetical protein